MKLADQGKIIMIDWSPVFFFMSERTMGYFRVFGYGLHWQSLRHHRKLWSDRERIYYQFETWAWLFTPLKRGERGFRRKK